MDGVGVVAVDLNVEHLAVAELDRSGNPVAAFRIACTTYGTSRRRRLAVLGDAVKAVVAYAREQRLPIVVEQLDFEAKKAELERAGARYARMLSGFTYAAFGALLRARLRRGAGCARGAPGLQFGHRAVHRCPPLRALAARGRGSVPGAAGRAAAHVARGRPGPEGPILADTGSGHGPGTARRAIRSSAAGEIPAHESSAALFS